MREEEFRNWQETQGYKASTVATQMSNARKIEQAYDLDSEFDTDGLASLEMRLAYSADDARADRPNPTPLELWGDLVRDLSNLRTTVRTYASFRRGGPATGADDRRFLLIEIGRAHV
jgi:hypothetical protein